jgi:hypothetical protein
MTRPRCVAAVTFVLLALLTGCQTTRLRSYGAFDLTNKTITVPPGGGLTGALKDALVENGWQIVAYRGPTITRGSIGSETNLETFKSFKTRYTLFASWNEFDVCVPFFDPAYAYDVAIVDNSSGTEVLSLSGRACERRIVNKFLEALNGGGK